MNNLLTLLVTAALLCGNQAAADERAQRGQPPRDRVDRYQGRDRRDGRDEQTERYTRTLKVGTSGEISISNISGHVSIVRGGGNEATLEVIKTARSQSSEDAKELLGLVEVDIVERGGRAEIKTRYPQGDEARRNNRRNINVSVAFTLTAPAGTRVSVHSISGDISSKDIRGDIALESVSGSVRIANAGRVAAAKTVSGGVEILDTEIEGQLEAGSVSGTVLVRNVKARSVEAGSVSGNVVIQDVTSDRVEGQTVSGDVQFSGPLARGGRYELSSHSGGVHVAIAGGTGFEIEATSFSGSVRSDIALNSQATDSGRRRQRSLRGIYGDGSAVLELTTFSGSIVVTKK